MPTDDLIRALLRGPDVVQVTLWVTEDRWGCSAQRRLRNAAVGRGDTMRQAIERTLAEVERGLLPVSVADAARRATVRLPEGGLGTLIRVDLPKREAVVRTPDGRHRRLPARSLALSDVEIQPLMSGERRYGEPVGIEAPHPHPPTSVDVS